MTLQEEKAALRKEIRARERALDPAYRAESSAGICTLLSELPEYRAAETVLAYYGLEREVDTRPFLSRTLGEGKRLCLPRCMPERRLDLCLVRDLAADLTPGPYGIWEPKADCPVLPPEDMDFALIPCTTFDRRGNRLGQGGGYYDRLLPRLRCPTVCACREALLAGRVPVDGLDMRCKVYLTEKGTVDCAAPPLFPPLF